MNNNIQRIRRQGTACKKIFEKVTSNNKEWLSKNIKHPKTQQ